MAKKKYTAYLSKRSMDYTAKLIRNYAKKLEAQTKEFCELLIAAGEEVIRADLATHNKGTGETLGSVKVIYDSAGGYYKAKVQVTSDAILFIEFGSGLHHAAPHAGAFKAGPGTFEQAPRQNPDFPNWANPEGWAYYDANGKLHWSTGMEPTAPMYKAGMEMERKVEEIARKVFV